MIYTVTFNPSLDYVMDINKDLLIDQKKNRFLLEVKELMFPWYLKT